MTAFQSKQARAYQRQAEEAESRAAALGVGALLRGGIRARPRWKESRREVSLPSGGLAGGALTSRGANLEGNVNGEHSWSHPQHQISQAPPFNSLDAARPRGLEAPLGETRGGAARALGGGWPATAASSPGTPLGSRVPPKRRQKEKRKTPSHTWHWKTTPGKLIRLQGGWGGRAAPSPEPRRSVERTIG